MTILTKITLKTSVHREKEVVQLHFERNEALQYLLRKNTLMRWSATMSCWYLPYTHKLTQELFVLVKDKAFLDYSLMNATAETAGVLPKPVVEKEKPGMNKELGTLSEEAEKKVLNFKQWMRSKRYSENTIGTYVDALRTFLRYCAKKGISEINNQDLIIFNNDYILANSLSSSFQNQVVNAIKLFFRTVENKHLDPALIHRPKRAKVLPNVLSKEEVKQILNALKNIKHRAMLSLIYSCGLRRSELLHLKLKDIDSGRGLIIVRQAKGKKDRVVPLSDKTLHMLRDYFLAYKPKEWLFEGQGGIDQYDERSLQNVLKQALEKAKINKPVSLHWLRHSYATHLLENGTDLRYIQEILGHSRSTTTEIYTHVSNKSIQKVISPFDSL
jgi:integrase/recombinase XerD